jgi:hypothetical protein
MRLEGREAWKPQGLGVGRPGGLYHLTISEFIKTVFGV